MTHVDPHLWPAVRPLLDRALHLEGDERTRFVERAGAINDAVHAVLVHLVRSHEGPAPAGPPAR